MNSKLVVVGGVAAGMSAASKARRMDPDMEIFVYERSGFVSYGACGLPYYVQGIIPDHHQLVARTQEQFAKRNIQVFIHHEVTRINPQQRWVEVKNLESGEVFKSSFDQLMLSTGGSAMRPPFPGLEPRASNLFSVRLVEDGIAIRRFIERERPVRAVIVGAGYIGIEMAEALVDNRLMAPPVLSEVTMLTLLPPLVPTVDADMSELVADKLGEHGVKLHVDRVQSFEQEEGRVVAVNTVGGSFPADLVIMATGVAPNTALAEQAGIALGPTGAVAVDDHQRTNIEGIYAGGDVAEALDLVTEQPTYVPLGTTANKQGRVAGENIAGGDAVFEGIVGTTVVKVFDVAAARAGLTETQARELGYDATSTYIKNRARAHYMPDGGIIHVKLVHENSGRLLGAQLVGPAVEKRIDVVAAALYDGWTIEDLTRLDLSYAPPFAPVWDPLLIAANVASD
jgi:NADPH-dependent 2,4-dienoyl-CoA reductase/sulfur reductase-like enzyme